MSSKNSWWELRKGDLTPRKWDMVRDAWLTYPIESPSVGSPPTDTVADLPNVQASLSGIVGQLPVEIYERIAGLHVGSLLEGIVLLHKATHVMGSAQLVLNSGMRTWSLSNAYQSAFFGMKAILHFLGIFVIEFNSGSFLVDLWTEPKTKKGKPKPMGAMVRAIKVPKVEHRPLWVIFQRMLNVTEVPESVWPASFAGSLRRLQESDFASQRNILHYRSYGWICNDLHMCSTKEGFGEIPDPDSMLPDAKAEDFTVVLSMVIVKMGIGLLADISQKSSTFKTDMELLNEWLSQEFNINYVTAFSGIA